MSGLKFDEGKRDWTLMPFEALEEVVKVLEHGERKYARDNWQEVTDGERRYTAAAFRHLIASRQERLDPESGLPHLAHAACCLLFLIHLDKEKTDEGIEYTRGDLSGLDSAHHGRIQES